MRPRTEQNRNRNLANRTVPISVSDQGTTMARSTSSCEKNSELSQDHFQRDFVPKLKSIVHFNRNILRLSEKIFLSKLRKKYFKSKLKYLDWSKILFHRRFSFQFNSIYETIFTNLNLLYKRFFRNFFLELNS
jgi:hypothetical protein